MDSKIRAFMKHLHATLLLPLALLLPAGAARAERADSTKPMNVEADNLRYDDLKQTSVFTGRVVLTKGTIIIRGARVDVKQDAEGYQTAIVIAAPDKLALYRKKRDNVDEYIEGEGERIEYDGKADRVKFVRRAEMRRYRGTVVSDEMNGNVITYENLTDVFSVDGGPPGSTAQPGGRVRAVLAPRSAASAAATPAAPPAGLRPSLTLGGDKK